MKPSARLHTGCLQALLQACCGMHDRTRTVTLVVVILPCRSTSVVRLLTRAFLWSAGLPSLATLFWCLMANTLPPFCGSPIMLQCEHPA